MNVVEQIYRKNEKRNHVSEDMRSRKPISMKNVLGAKGKKLIIEYKRESPSGFYDPSFSSPEKFGDYVKDYADAFSVLTEPDHFAGNFTDGLSLQKFEKPILMKDFIDREEMIETSYNCGFDAILLIADFLPASRMEELAGYAESMHMDVLAEFHDREIFDRIPQGKNVICGYNRRNLRTLKMEGNEDQVVELMAGHEVKVLESGLDRSNYRRLLKMPFDGYLIGSSVLKEPKFVIEIKKEGSDYDDERNE